MLRLLSKTSSCRPCVRLSNPALQFKRTAKLQIRQGINTHIEYPAIHKQGSSIGGRLSFLASFTVFAFAAGTVVEYERFLAERNEEISPAESIWKSITGSFTGVKYKDEDELTVTVWEKLRAKWDDIEPKQKVFGSLMAANGLVFLAWRSRSLRYGVLSRRFVDSPGAKPISMLLSTFSHKNPAHLALNMFALYQFGSSVYDVLGPERFVGLYLSGGVFASFASSIAKLATGSALASLGASGAVFTIIAADITLNPEANLALVFLPFVAIPAKYALGGIVALDSYGVLAGWQTLDHAAHLGGTAFGIAFMSYGAPILSKFGQNVILIWEKAKKSIN
eukprot:Clim_evm61s25 gene=Clim_evmTU61s25